MSVVAEVKHLIANEADGALKALHHLAQKFEELASGAQPAVAADLGAIGKDIEAKVEASLSSLVKAAADKVDAALEGMQTQFHADLDAAKARYEAAANNLEQMFVQLKAATTPPALPAAAPAEQAVPANQPQS